MKISIRRKIGLITLAGFLFLGGKAKGIELPDVEELRAMAGVAKLAVFRDKIQELSEEEENKIEGFFPEIYEPLKILVDRAEKGLLGDEYLAPHKAKKRLDWIKKRQGPNGSLVIEKGMFSKSMKYIHSFIPEQKKVIKGSEGFQFFSSFFPKNVLFGTLEIFLNSEQPDEPMIQRAAAFSEEVDRLDALRKILQLPDFSQRCSELLVDSSYFFIMLKRHEYKIEKKEHSVLRNPKGQSYAECINGDENNRTLFEIMKKINPHIPGVINSEVKDKDVKVLEEYLRNAGLVYDFLAPAMSCVNEKLADLMRKSVFKK